MTEAKRRDAWILLVEDNLTDAVLTQATLERDGGVRVVIAQDGIRGCELVEAQRWDLVITDLNLPGRDGVEVIQASKAHQPDTPVVAISAYSEPSWTDAAEREGADEVLPKPLEPEEVARTVRELLAMRIREQEGARRILAVSALPGDVEAGCGATLLKCVGMGDRVEVLVLSTGAEGGESEDRRAACRRACELLDLHLHLPPRDAPKLPEMDHCLMRLGDLLDDLSPQLILSPSPNDVRESRQRAFEAAKVAATDIGNFLCYQSATTTLDFRPTVFEEVSDYLDQKMLALSFFEAQDRGRPHLDPELARATARYWGRFLGYGNVEPFEVIRQQL